MELQPELTPPALDETKVNQLAELAAQLDGANSGGTDPAVWEAELDDFNRIAGTSLGIQEFQGIYGAEEHDQWVRRLLYTQSLVPTANLSREEMTEIVSRTLAGVASSEGDFYLELFLVNCKHPSGSNLLFYPNLVPELPQDREPTAEEIADVALGWEPRVVAMQVARRSGGDSVGYYLYNLVAPGTPDTQIVTSLDHVYPTGAVLAVALKGIQLPDGSQVKEDFLFGPMSCGKILGPADQPLGTRLADGFAGT